jgi:hypothetical protein
MPIPLNIAEAVGKTSEADRRNAMRLPALKRRLRQDHHVPLIVDVDVHVHVARARATLRERHGPPHC